MVRGIEPRCDGNRTVKRRSDSADALTKSEGYHQPIANSVILRGKMMAGFRPAIIRCNGAARILPG